MRADIMLSLVARCNDVFLPGLAASRKLLISQIYLGMRASATCAVLCACAAEGINRSDRCLWRRFLLLGRRRLLFQRVADVNAAGNAESQRNE